MSYLDEAKSDAADTAVNFRDEILEMLMDDGKASDDLMNDYPNGDSYHHENHTDKSYDMGEAGELIEELSEYEEADSGLWEGCDFRRAAGICAAYTYGNAVYALFQQLIEEINNIDVDAIKDTIRDEMKDAKRPHFESEVTAEFTADLDEDEELDDDAVEKEVEDRLASWIDDEDTEIDTQAKAKVAAELDEIITNFR